MQRPRNLRFMLIFVGFRSQKKSSKFNSDLGMSAYNTSRRDGQKKKSKWSRPTEAGQRPVGGRGREASGPLIAMPTMDVELGERGAGSEVGTVLRSMSVMQAAKERKVKLDR